ncbi:unnamed protein product [Microthlaspi erraticum]|uniref:F-box domain-containing protein n=1 Tax=Microthlaspi erraticum TaxID=1685480 RepID=A0A6D2HKU7_9BRAS|nr:unnamed protein product [Microthlaspi erraticum]
MTNPSAPPPPPPPLPLYRWPSFSSLPDEIVVNCLARISKSHYRSLSSVSKGFHSLLSSPEIYSARSQIGATEPRLYVCLRFPTAPHRRYFTLTVKTDQTLISSNGGENEIKSELSFVRVKHCSSARLNATTVAVGSEIYQMGGSSEGKRSRAVRVLDCRSNTLRRAPGMKVARKRARSRFLDGKIYVFGGCKKREESMNWVEVFDIKTQTWKGPLPKPPLSGDGKHKVVVLGARIYVITEHDKYAYDPEGERWVLPEKGLVDLELIVTQRAGWCVVGNVVYHEYLEKLRWYDVSCGSWVEVEGLSDLYEKRAYDYGMIQLVSYGRKLVMIWREWTDHVFKGMHGREIRSGLLDIRIWVAVIRLKKRPTQIWGEVERYNVVARSSFKSSYKFLTCLSVSL